MGGCGLMEDVSDLLGAVVGDFDTDKCLICREGLTKAFLLTLREPITTGAQKKPDLIEGIPLASAVTQGVLLDAAAHLTWSVASLCDDVTGIEHAGGVLGAGQGGGVLAVPGRGSSVAIRTPARKSFPRSAHRSCTRCQTCPGPGPTSGPWDDPSREWSTMPVSSRGPRRRRSWWCHTPLIDPGCPHACEAGGVIRCGRQARLEKGPHGVPRGCQLSSQSCNGGSLEAQLSDRPADRPAGRPRPQTRPGSTHLLAVLQECHRLAGAFAAHPAPYCATGSAPGPRPRARRSPPPPHARDLERFSPQPGQPAQRSQDSTSSTRPHSRRAAATRWKPSKLTGRSHRSQRPSDTEQQQVG